MTIKLFRDASKSIQIGQIPDQETVDHVPAAIYTFVVTFSPSGVSYSLEYRGAKLPVPDQRYGDHEEKVRTLVNDYDRVNPPFGAIACGLKGAGKSILFNDASNRLVASGTPVIQIESNIAVEHLRFLIKVIGPCVLYFDEFGKIYGKREERESLLTFFSDASLTGCVWFVCGNSEVEFSDFILNRPGRFRYRFNMKSLPRSALTDFFKQHHIPSERINWLLSQHEAVTYDILMSLKQQLRTSQSFPEFQRATNWLNVPQFSAVRLELDGDTTLDDRFLDVKSNLIGEVREDAIYLRYIDREGNPGESILDYIDRHGNVILDEYLVSRDGRLKCELNIIPARCVDRDLVGSSPIFNQLSQHRSNFRNLSKRHEDTSDDRVTTPGIVQQLPDKDADPFGFHCIEFSIPNVNSNGGGEAAITGT